MVVLALGREDRRVTKAVPDIVQGIPTFDPQHPPGDAVAECVGRDVIWSASSREAVRANASATSAPLDDVVDPLAGHPTGLLAGHQSGIVVDASLEELSKCRDGPQGVVPIELEGHGRRGAVVGVVLLD